jgi:hypothetical protein
LSEAIDGRSRSGPFFRPDQIDAMHKAFEKVRTKLRLRGPKAMAAAELVAIRIVELAREGEFDPDKLTEAEPDWRRARATALGSRDVPRPSSGGP